MEQLCVSACVGRQQRMSGIIIKEPEQEAPPRKSRKRKWKQQRDQNDRVSHASRISSPAGLRGTDRLHLLGNVPICFFCCSASGCVTVKRLFTYRTRVTPCGLIIYLKWQSRKPLAEVTRDVSPHAWGHVSSRACLFLAPEIHGYLAGPPFKNEQGKGWQKWKSQTGFVSGPGTHRTQSWHLLCFHLKQMSHMAHSLTSLSSVIKCKA